MAKMIIKKIRLNLTRDETLAINDLIPYWKLLQESKLNQRNQPEMHYMSIQTTICIIQQIENIFYKRMQSFSNKHKFTFTPAEAIVMIVFLKGHPIKSDDIFLQILRQQVIDILHPQI
jgi:hypothetical protein